MATNDHIFNGHSWPFALIPFLAIRALELDA